MLRCTPTVRSHHPSSQLCIAFQPLRLSFPYSFLSLVPQELVSTLILFLHRPFGLTVSALSVSDWLSLVVREWCLIESSLVAVLPPQCSTATLRRPSLPSPTCQAVSAPMPPSTRSPHHPPSLPTPPTPLLRGHPSDYRDRSSCPRSGCRIRSPSLPVDPLDIAGRRLPTLLTLAASRRSAVAQARSHMRRAISLLPTRLAPTTWALHPPSTLPLLLPKSPVALRSRPMAGRGQQAY